MPSFDFVLVKKMIKTISADVKNAANNLIALWAVVFFAMIGACLAPRRREQFAY